jgi:LacI family transcriptional regulator
LTRTGSGGTVPLPKPFSERTGAKAEEGRTPSPGIRELAERLGVSVATVSRVLNDYPDVAPETRERVRAAIREERFVPDRVARSLATGRSHVIGVVLETGAGHPHLQHPFFQEVLVGLREALASSGYDLLLLSGDGSDGAFEGHSYLDRLRHHRVDGVLLMGADPRGRQIEEVLASGIPCMAVDLDVRGNRAGYVESDNVLGTGLAVHHLHELGHRRIAFIGGTSGTKAGADRLLGFRCERDRLGLPERPEYLEEGDFYPASGQAAMARLLELTEPPTAVVVAADLMAAGAMQAIGERGLRVPEDVAVVGFDDIQIAPLLRPALTTIRQDKLGLGAAAADSLVRLIADPETEPPVITIPVELVVRESSGGRRMPMG